MCLSNEEMASLRDLSDTLQETVELVTVLYDSIAPSVGNSNGVVEPYKMKVALRPSQVPIFYEGERVKA
jgi:hypothetical protein